jgi:DNA processing protein
MAGWRRALAAGRWPTAPAGSWPAARGWPAAQASAKAGGIERYGAALRLPGGERRETGRLAGTRFSVKSKRWITTCRQARSVGRAAYGQAGFSFEMVRNMSSARERAAVLALARATDGPWHHTSRAIQAGGGALRLIGGDFTGLGDDDRAHAAEVVSRVGPGDLAWAENLIAAEPHARLVTVLDDDYPGNLDFAYNFQPFLWVRGPLLPGDGRSVAVAGDGPAAAHACDAAAALGKAGLTVVAGLGPGGDAAVHEAALTAGGRSIAVLAQGFATPSGTAENTTVATGIARVAAGGGAVVSPFWPAAASSARTIALARIVTSGLAVAVYVAGGLDGGAAAAQAELALKQGKHVFVPQWLHQAQPWVRRLGYRGGVTVVAGIDDLLTSTVTLIDVNRQPTSF